MVSARNTFSNPKTKPRFVIVNVITSRAIGQPTKLIPVISESNSQVNAAQNHGVKINWQLYRCEASWEPQHVIQ